jgi:uncharacterized membrane protein YbhN (UPF0104 family)
VVAPPWIRELAPLPAAGAVARIGPTVDREPRGDSVPSIVYAPAMSAPLHGVGATSGTGLLDRPVRDDAPRPPGAIGPVGAAPAVAVPAPALRPAPRTRAGFAARPSRRVARRVVAGLAVAGAVALLAAQLRDTELAAALVGVRPAHLALAAGWFALSLLAAAYNLTGFSGLRLRLGPTLLAQLAVGGLRLVVPSALSQPAVMMRYLVRSGASVPDAATTVGASQSAQLVATAAVVGVLGLGTGPGWSPMGGGALAVGAAVLAGFAGVAVIAASLSRRVRGWLRMGWRSQRDLAAHARRHPGRVGVGLLASAGLTLTHVLAFAACVAAAGGSLPLLTLVAVYLGAAAAGSLVPTPGGIGAVEAALVAGLAAAGLALPVATAATLLSRLVAVWLPALPGLAAVAVLRRRHLL